MNYFGRTKTIVDTSSINGLNVIDVFNKAIASHGKNHTEIDDLYNFYKGDQPILTRTKQIRKEILNKIVENRAFEFIEFKTGYLLEGEIKYIARTQKTEDIDDLNDMMLNADKSTFDVEMVEWAYTVGTSIAYIEPNRDYIKSEVIPKIKKNNSDFAKDNAPFKLHCLDPRTSFCIYSSELGEKCIGGVNFVYTPDGVVYTLVTHDTYYTIKGNKVVSTKTNPLGMVPFVEFPLNKARLGLVEIVVSILNAMNTVQSNRIDGIEQFIQSLLVMVNAEVDEEDRKLIRKEGYVNIKSYGENKSEVKILNEELNQMQTQALVDYMYQTLLNIIGMPNRSGGGGSTSDTGSATLIRDGWEATERRAKKDEKMRKKPERQLLRIVLNILRSTVGTNLSLSDIEIKYPARSYKNKSAMAQMLVQMLSTDKIHPQLAFEECGLFDDPQRAYLMSKEFYDNIDREVVKTQDDREVVKTQKPEKA